MIIYSRLLLPFMTIWLLQCEYWICTSILTLFSRSIRNYCVTVLFPFFVLPPKNPIIKAITKARTTIFGKEEKWPKNDQWVALPSFYGYPSMRVKYNTTLLWNIGQKYLFFFLSELHFVEKIEKLHWKSIFNRTSFRVLFYQISSHKILVT